MQYFDVNLIDYFNIIFMNKFYRKKRFVLNLLI
jgi:hypothetical protein